MKNPDTGLFMRYRLAGAYDSNVALLLATGATRDESWARLTEVLRRTRIRGIDLATNREFHLGLMKWFLHRDPWAKPTTKFVVPYLTPGRPARAGGARRSTSSTPFTKSSAGASPRSVPRRALCFDLKETLIERPLRLLFQEPHFLSAWLSQHLRDFDGARRARDLAPQPGRDPRRHLSAARHDRRRQRAAAEVHLEPRPRRCSTPPSPSTRR